MQSPLPQKETASEPIKIFARFRPTSKPTSHLEFNLADPTVLTGELISEA